MNKRNLMLSAATAALLAGPAFATATCTTVTTTNPDCITTSTSTALTTGAADTGGALETASIGTANVGDIYIESGGSVAPGTAGIGAITVNNNSYVYSDGAISNNGVGTATNSTTSVITYASGILVDVSKNPTPTDSFTNVASETISTTSTPRTGIYLDSASTLDLTGSGTSKRGIWLNAINGDGTYTGDITFVSGSITEVDGDSSVGVFISPTSSTTVGAIGAILKGDLSLGGTFTMSQTTASSTTASGLYGVLMEGEVDGNILLPANGTMTISGAGATGMSIQGAGVTGSISIGGTLATAGCPTTTACATSSSTLTNTSNTVYPEAGSALVVSASVGNGIAILGPDATGTSAVVAGTVSTYGTSAAIVIDPAVNAIVTTPVKSLEIGLYTTDGHTMADTVDPGFSFYNRGTVTAQPMNANNATSDAYNAVGVQLSGPSTFPTILDGGIFNSGSITVSATTTGTVANGNNVTAMSIGAYTHLDTATFNSSTGTWTDTSLAAKTGVTGDQAALVNSNSTGGGKITATVSGTRGGTAIAIAIAQYASVPSLINSGTITASATVIDATITNPLQAIAIEDASGTLTSIYNTGTIQAIAGVSTTSGLTALDNNSQVADAILLGDRLTGTTVRIDDISTLANSAVISGNVYFGSGGTQILNIQGTGGHAAAVAGDVTFNGSGTSGDQLWVGSYASLSGTVIADNGVSIDIAQNGVLALANTITPLYATSLTVHGGTTPTNGGALSLGVSNALTSSGVISATGNVLIEANANLGVTYNSFVPQASSGGADNFVLITAPLGKLSILPATINLYNTSLQTNVSSGGALPFLFESASLECISTNPTSTGCTAPASGDVTDSLVLHVVPKTAVKLGLTGYASQMFLPANAALEGNTAAGGDYLLGAAMVNGIHNAAQAQAAYNAFAPNVTGGSRAIVISITDQATGVVGARQRMLNLYGKQEGGATLWGQEFVQMIKDPGQGALQADGTKMQSGFKDHGFGFALGIDGGSPKYGWYGGAFTFYTGDVGEIKRDSHINEQWYILSGYSTWRGKGLFFDSKIDVGYGHFDGKRLIALQTSETTPFTREADNTHPGTMISGGFTMGGIFAYGATTLSPQISVDGLLMREEGYTEHNPDTPALCAGTTNVCDAFDLKVEPYYAKSLRVFLGGSVRYDLDLWEFYLQPEAHAGFRYDLFNDPMKLKAAFAYADQTTGGAAGPGTQFTMTGPDPSQGNFVLGGSLATTTDAWTLGFNFDFVKGSNGLFEEVGTVNLLGRI